VSYGCGRLARTLTRLGLVDELRIWVAPLVVGSGTHLLDDPADPIDLRLTGTKAFPIGTVVLSYEPAS
jgi:dihydrofolate reductase